MASIEFSAIVTDTYTSGSYTYPRRTITASVSEDGVYHGPQNGNPTRNIGTFDLRSEVCFEYYFGILSDTITLTGEPGVVMCPAANLVYRTYSVATMSGVTTADDLLANISRDEIVTADAIYQQIGGIDTTAVVAVPITGTPAHFFASAPTHVIFAGNGSTSIATASPPNVNAGCVPALGVSGKCHPNYSSGPFIAPVRNVGSAADKAFVYNQTSVVYIQGTETRCYFNEPDGGGVWGGSIYYNGALPAPTSVIVGIDVDLDFANPKQVRAIIRLTDSNGDTTTIWTGSARTSSSSHNFAETATVSATVPDGAWGYSIDAEWEWLDGSTWKLSQDYPHSFTTYARFAGLLSDTQLCPLAQKNTGVGWGYCPAFTSTPVALSV